MDYKLISDFASPERESIADIMSENDMIVSMEYFKEIFNSISSISVLLNKNRQVLFASNDFKEMLGLQDDTEILGMRPGEIVSCIHAFDQNGGCGTSEACKMCGAVNAVIECLNFKHKISKEARLVSTINNRKVSWDFLITAIPLKLNEKEYCVVTFNDISSSKRKNNFERIFLHDILNMVFGLKVISTVLKRTKNNRERENIINNVERTSQSILDHIIYFKQIISAESGEIVLDKTTFEIRELIYELLKIVSVGDEVNNETIVIDPETQFFTINADRTLLYRILLNMLKNAIEAQTDEKKQIVIGARKENNHIRIWVKNDYVIPENIRMQIFYRSFSTKGVGRGIGTYSMKLLGENYLNGKVGFTSNKEQGTIFYIILPDE